MTDEEYLKAILADQTLTEGSEELRALRRHKADVETLLKNRFGSPSIRYGGSYTKGTMIKESYDLDITCYFARDDDAAGSTLKEIYESVEEALREKYWTEPKGSAIRLRSRDDRRHDFHIDVVPGRFVDGKDGDVYLYRSMGEKQRLKTNLDVHITHVKRSGVVPAIRLLKLWVLRNYIGIKTFALELLVIKLLEGRNARGLPDQLEHVLKEFRDRAEAISIEDPANPQGNDLSEMLDASIRGSLESAARATLDRLNRDGWEAVFGPAEKADEATKLAALRRMGAAATVRPKPYHGG